MAARGCGSPCEGRQATWPRAAASPARSVWGPVPAPPPGSAWTPDTGHSPSPLAPPWALAAPVRRERRNRVAERSEPKREKLLDAPPPAVGLAGGSPSSLRSKQALRVSPRVFVHICHRPPLSAGLSGWGGDSPWAPQPLGVLAPRRCPWPLPCPGSPAKTQRRGLGADPWARPLRPPARAAWVPTALDQAQTMVCPQPAAPRLCLPPPPTESTSEPGRVSPALRLRWLRWPLAEDRRARGHSQASREPGHLPAVWHLGAQTLLPTHLPSGGQRAPPRVAAAVFRGTGHSCARGPGTAPAHEGTAPRPPRGADCALLTPRRVGAWGVPTLGPGGPGTPAAPSRPLIP